MLDEREIQAVTLPLAEASTLPPRAYTDAEVFDRETREIFYREWICVAREEQLPEPGDYRRVDVLDQPLIVVRLEDGTLRAHSAVCPHRGMPIVESDGHASSFSCPYHLWKFRLDGGLISAPLMDGAESFPGGNCDLASVRVETWHGFVFVNLDADAPPLAARLGELESLMDGYDMADMVVCASEDFDCPWNWKLLVENFMEAYHHIGPHNDSLQSTYHAKDSHVSGSVDDGWSVLHMPVSAAALDEHETGLPALPNLDEQQQSQTTASVIMPTFCWINTPSIAFWYELKPAKYDAMQLTIHTLLPRSLAESEAGELIAAGVQETIRHIHLEDIAVNEGPWRGLHAPLARQGRLSLLEESIWQLNQWWVARVANAG